MQSEVPGTERPKIEEIDKLVEEQIKAEAERDAVAARVSAAKQGITLLMVENREQLEKDKDGNFVYVYRNGEETEDIVLPSIGNIRRRKHKEANFADNDGSGEVG